MTDRGSRRGAANLAPLLMIVSLAAMVGLLVWLGATAEGTSTVIMDETGGAQDSLEMGAVEVPRDTLRLQMDRFVGQLVRLTAVSAVSNLGTEAFFTDLGGGAQSSSPFLIKLSADLVAQGQTLPQGVVTIVGTLHERTDSVSADWLASGAISSGDVVLVDFASHFIEATVIR